MGKSTAAAAFRRARLPVFDADAAVHRLQSRGGRAVPAIAAAFPGTVLDGTIDRARLRAAAIGNPAAMKTLERILHPLVRAMERRFLAAARRARQPAAVLDIPLLLETGGQARTDLVLVVSAPPAIQRARVRQRRRMTPRPDRRHHRPADARPPEAPPGRRRRADRTLEASRPTPAPPPHPEPPDHRVRFVCYLHRLPSSCVRDRGKQRCRIRSRDQAWKSARPPPRPTPTRRSPAPAGSRTSAAPSSPCCSASSSSPPASP